MANRRKSINRQRRSNRRHTGKSGGNLSKQEVELISRRNAKTLVQGRSRLRSWGYSGWYRCERLGKYYNYRSRLEREVIEKLDKLDDIVVQFDTEKVIIPYFYKGAQLNYVPDVILKTTSGNVYILEIKYTRDLNAEKNKEKWEAARDFAVAYGATFKVITEKDIDNLREILTNKHILTEEEKRRAGRG